MGHNHSHDHGAGANAKKLTIALVLTGSFLIVEVIGGFYFNSLALLSDAAHMMTDVVALSIALMAIKIGQRPPDDKRSFGYRRFEILAATFNAVLLFAIAIYILFEAVDRFTRPQEVQSWGMLIVATFGLIVNIISMRLLTSAKDDSMNVKGAYLEVWADMIGSVGVIIGALMIKFTGWTWVDPVVAALIGFWVLPRTWMLLRDTTNVLLEGVPSGMDLADVRKSIHDIDGVIGVHDLHVWSISNNAVNATAHVVAAEGADHDALRRTVIDLFANRFDIEHLTVQIESDGAHCETNEQLHP